MSKNIQNNCNSYSGLYLFGKVIDRTRRHVPKDNPTTEIVTYLIQSNRDSKFYVADYAPKSYYDIDADVSLSVFIKTYKHKNREPSYTLNIQPAQFFKGRTFLISRWP